jgi:hypothetical protein
MEIWNGKKAQEFRRALIERDLRRDSSFLNLCSRCNSMIRADAMGKGNAWPYDFNKETDVFFNNDEDYFGFHPDREKLEPKFEFLKKYSDKWIEQMINPRVSDDEFVQKYKIG